MFSDSGMYKGNMGEAKNKHGTVTRNSMENMSGGRIRLLRNSPNFESGGCIIETIHKWMTITW